MKATNNILERQIIRFICIILALWSMVSAMQLTIVYFVSVYTTWFDKYIDSNWLIVAIVGIQFIIGSLLLYAKWKHNYNLVLTSLTIMIAYNLSLASLAAYFTKGQSSFFMNYALIACLSIILYRYYKKRDNDFNDDRDLVL